MRKTHIARRKVGFLKVDDLEKFQEKVIELVRLWISNCRMFPGLGLKGM